MEQNLANNEIGIYVMKIAETLQKIQNLPLTQRKIIFWVTIILLSSILLSLYAINVKHKLENLSVEKTLEELKVPELKEKIENSPNFGVGEELGKIKNEITEINKILKKNQKVENQK